MNMTLLQNQKYFPLRVKEKLSALSLDYQEKNAGIERARRGGEPSLKAAVVLLLHFKKTSDPPEYVFHLIKRSRNVSQGGDISCPGGMVHPQQDALLRVILKATLLPARLKKTDPLQNRDKETTKLIHLFLTAALREAWEEIGLNPFRTKFLGALPSYALTMFPRTIFPVVCLTSQSRYRLNAEVERIVEIPIRFFFNSGHYATLHIKTLSQGNPPTLLYQTPCLTIPDDGKGEEILWGATFNIIHHFLNIISDNAVPLPSSSRQRDKVLTPQYLSPQDTPND